MTDLVPYNPSQNPYGNWVNAELAYRGVILGLDLSVDRDVSSNPPGAPNWTPTADQVISAFRSVDHHTLGGYRSVERSFLDPISVATLRWLIVQHPVLSQDFINVVFPDLFEGDLESQNVDLYGKIMGVSDSVGYLDPRSELSFDSTLGYPGEGPPHAKGKKHNKEKKKERRRRKKAAKKHARSNRPQRAAPYAKKVNGPSFVQLQGAWGPGFEILGRQKRDIAPQHRREFIQDVVVSQQGTWDPSAVTNRPFYVSNNQVLPVASVVANLYTLAKFKRLCFEFVPNQTVLFGGMCYVAWDPDPDGQETYDLRTVENMQNRISFTPAPTGNGSTSMQPRCLEIPTSEMNPRAKQGLLTRPGATPSDYVAGRLIVGTDGITQSGTPVAAGQVIGKLYVRYDFDLHDLRPVDPVGAGLFVHAICSSVATATPFGVIANWTYYSGRSDIVQPALTGSGTALNIYATGRFMLLFQFSAGATVSIDVTKWTSATIAGGKFVAWETTGTQFIGANGGTANIACSLVDAQGSNGNPCLITPAASWATVAGGTPNVRVMLLQVPNDFNSPAPLQSFVGVQSEIDQLRAELKLLRNSCVIVEEKTPLSLPAAK